MGDRRWQAGCGAGGRGEFENVRNRLAAWWKPLECRGLRHKSHAGQPDECGVLRPKQSRKCLEISKTILLCEVVARGAGD